MRIALQTNPREQTQGTLYPDEIALAKTVFADTLPYEKIFIGRFDFGGAMTIATSPFQNRANYIILWANAYNKNLAKESEYYKATFIHELTHVWQSLYAGYAMAYIAESAWAQLREGVKDMFKDGVEKGLERAKEVVKKGMQQWGVHRSHAYIFRMSEIGNSWNSFNVEQQGSIVESWFQNGEHTFVDGSKVPGGNRSPKDARYSYIKNNILAKDPNAAYVGGANLPGFSAEIAEYQAVLFRLGYLTDEKYVDGYWGRITSDAVREFQRKNGLKPDGELRGVRTETQRKLRQPIDTLVPK